MLSIELARRLRRSGLTWSPQLHDTFHIPDRNLDDRVFVLADLTIDIHHLDGHAAIMFNGAVEWSLDYILQQDVVWVPSESQLRDLLGDRLVALTRGGDGYRCTIAVGGRGEVNFDADSAPDAYGTALLHLLETGNEPTS